MRSKELRVVIKSIIISLLIFFLGFGMLYVFWKIGNFEEKNTGLKGLFSYKSAYIGDSLFLPIFVGSMYSYVNLHDILESNHKKYGNGFGIIGLIIGVIIQVSWLFNKNIEPNWSIPKPNHFNYVGWYHAGYFIFMFFICFKLFLETIITKHKSNTSSEEKPQDIISMFLMWLSISGYMFMQVLDRGNETINNWKSIIIYNLIAIIVFCIINIFTYKNINMNKDIWKKIINDIVYIVSAVISSTAISICIFNPLRQGYILSIILILFSITAIIIDEKSIGIKLGKYIILAITVSSLNSLMFNIPSNIQTSNQIIVKVVIGILALILCLAISATQKKLSDIYKINEYSFINGLFVSIIIINSIIFLTKVEGASEIADALMQFVINNLSAIYIKKVFDKVIEEENKLLNGNAKLEKIKREIYLHIIFVTVGAFLYLLWNFIQFMNKNKEGLILSRIEFTNIEKYIGSLIIILLCIMCMLKLLKNKYASKIIGLIIMVITYFCICFFFVNLRESKISYSWFANLFSILVIIEILGASLMISIGFYYNVCGIRGMKEKFNILMVKMTSIIMFFGSFVSLYFMIYIEYDKKGMIKTSIAFCLIGLVGMLILTTIIPMIIANILREKDKPIRVPLNTVLSGVMQNGVTTLILIVFGVYMPIILLSISSGKWYDVCIVTTFILSIIWALMYCLENNVKHCSKMKEDTDKKCMQHQAEEEYLKKEYKNLRKFLRIQNITTCITVFPYCLLPIIQAIFSAILNQDREKSIPELVKSVWDKYMPK